MKNYNIKISINNYLNLIKKLILTENIQRGYIKYVNK